MNNSKFAKTGISALGLGLVLALVISIAGIGGNNRAKAGWFDLGDLLEGAAKVVGVEALINEFGDDIDNFINKYLDNENAAVASATKVVPILSPIGNKHIGAAQVVGPQAAVADVEAVVQLETSFQDKLFRIKVMIPSDSKDPTDFNRVEGVGVSAVIDIKL